MVRDNVWENLPGSCNSAVHSVNALYLALAQLCKNMFLLITGDPEERKLCFRECFHGAVLMPGTRQRAFFLSRVYIGFSSNEKL